MFLFRTRWWWIGKIEGTFESQESSSSGCEHQFAIVNVKVICLVRKNRTALNVAMVWPEIFNEFRDAHECCERGWRPKFRWRSQVLFFLLLSFSPDLGPYIYYSIYTPSESEPLTYRNRVPLNIGFPTESCKEPPKVRELCLSNQFSVSTSDCAPHRLKMR